MTKYKQISVRISQEIHANLEQIDNKSEYVKQLIINDLTSDKNSLFKNEITKQNKINNIKLMGQVSNAVHKYRGIKKNMSERPHAKLLKREFCSLMRSEMNKNEDPDIKKFVAYYIKKFEEDLE